MLCNRCRTIFSSPSGTRAIFTNYHSNKRSLITRQQGLCTRITPRSHALQTNRQTSTQTNTQTSTHTTDGPLQRPQLKKEWRIHPMTPIPIVCLILGWWQVERRKWKLQLIADIESRYQLEPVPFDSSVEYLEYTPVQITGEYDYSTEFYLGPRHEIVDYRDKGAPGGYHSIVPMTLESGERILVDRGWVDRRTKSPAGQIRGKVTQVGYIRQPEGAVMPLLAPASGSSQTYIWRDTEVMARCSRTLPVTVELTAECTIEDGPLGGQTRLSVYNKHLEYVITWWGMGLASLFYIFTVRRKPKAIPNVFK